MKDVISIPKFVVTAALAALVTLGGWQLNELVKVKEQISVLSTEVRMHIASCTIQQAKNSERLNHISHP